MSPLAEKLLAMTTWRLRTTLVVPTTVPIPPGGGMPQTLQFISRVPDQARDYSGRRVRLKSADGSPEAQMYAGNPQVKLVDLLTEVEGDDAWSAIRSFGPTFESILDLMAFQMGTPIGVGQSYLVDVTPPVAAGDDRRFEQFPMSPCDKNARQVEMQAIRGLVWGQLPDISSIQDSRVAAALRWFIKSLGTVMLHDQFIFLWIALETLCDDSDVSVEQPYKGSCGHEIPACPRCDRPTSMKVRGATIKAFLETFDVNNDDSGSLWRMRQMMHGAIPFDSAKLDGLPSLLQVLRAAVALGLKDRFGIPRDGAPLIASSGLTIHPSTGLGGTRAITEDDIEPL
jgi:hypothetical protein